MANSVEYDSWLADALAAGELRVGYDMRDRPQLIQFVSRFNYEIDATNRQHGKDKVGKSIWFIYGASSGYMSDILDPSVGELRFAFMESVKALYAEGFDRHVWRFLYRDRLESLHWDVLEQDRAIIESLARHARRKESLYQHDIGIVRVRRLMEQLAARQIERQAEQAAA